MLQRDDAAFYVYVYLNLQESHEISVYPFVFFVVVFRRRRFSFSIYIRSSTAFSVRCCELFARPACCILDDEWLRASRIHNTNAHSMGFCPFPAAIGWLQCHFVWLVFALCVPFGLLRWIASPVLFWSKFSWVWNIVWVRGFSLRCARFESGVLLWILNIENFVHFRF